MNRPRASAADTAKGRLNLASYSSRGAHLFSGGWQTTLPGTGWIAQRIARTSAGSMPCSSRSSSAASANAWLKWQIGYGFTAVRISSQRVPRSSPTASGRFGRPARWVA